MVWVGGEEGKVVLTEWRKEGLGRVQAGDTDIDGNCGRYKKSPLVVVFDMAAAWLAWRRSGVLVNNMQVFTVLQV